jgi:hypothetical protein
VFKLMRQKGVFNAFFPRQSLCKFVFEQQALPIQKSSHLRGMDAIQIRDRFQE